MLQRALRLQQSGAEGTTKALHSSGLGHWQVLLSMIHLLVRVQWTAQDCPQRIIICALIKGFLNAEHCVLLPSSWLESSYIFFCLNELAKGLVASVHVCTSSSHCPSPQKHERKKKKTQSDFIFTFIPRDAGGPGNQHSVGSSSGCWLGLTNCPVDPPVRAAASDGRQSELFLRFLKSPLNNADKSERRFHGKALPRDKQERFPRGSD